MSWLDDGEIATTVQVVRAPRSEAVAIDTQAWKDSSNVRFFREQLHGEGGLGRVWLAHDRRLNREVAIKEIRSSLRDSSSAMRRFLIEAQIAAQLEHPNIVPVYDLDRSPVDGRPFYAMRFVRGRTLREAIAEYHRGGASDRWQLIHLLQAFTSVCNALAYAHARGVIHRDVKPDNVILGAFGEVLLIDWGLARVTGGSDGGAAPEETAEEHPVHLTGVPTTDHTANGTRLGTPAYMSPEQAAGRVSQIGRHADIYGAGAVLFEVLTGRPPHAGKGRNRFERIAEEPTPTVRSINRRAPAALAAICAKAMARAPEDRYDQAGDLAADVQRYLADEPVAAYAEPILARAVRWARRHRTWMQAAAAALILVTLVSVAALWFVNRARAREEAERQLAEAQFRRARATVDDLLTGVSEETLLNRPGLQPLRERLLRRALDYYREFAQQSQDPARRADLAAAHFRVGRILMEIGSKREAEARLRQATSLLEQLNKAFPIPAHQKHLLAQSHLQLGIVQLQTNQMDQARTSLD
ncbi:MAG TPA: serine/threonine protein kinase, partial [Planctomycetaceae bacterium]|nr:serine/threonine protein kinase [Planctomycetaceae bacterium]